MTELAISTEFFNVFEQYNKLSQNISSPDEEMNKCISQAHHLYNRIEKENIYSSNEQMDDINTGDLKYILVLYYLSDLYYKKNMPHRSQSLKLSFNYGKMFLNRCDSWNILTKFDRKIFERDYSSINIHELANKYKNNPLELMNYFNNKKKNLDPQEQRNELINITKKRKEVQNKIDTLLSENKKKFNIDNNSNDDHTLFEDESIEREYWILLINSSIYTIFNNFKNTLQELPLALMNDEKSKESSSLPTSTSTSTSSMIGTDEKKPKKPSVMVINPDHSVEKYNSISEMKSKKETQLQSQAQLQSQSQLLQNSLSQGIARLTMKNNIDSQVLNRIDRNQVIKESNPWTYTPEDAALLGLLPEIPKDYFENQKLQKLKDYEQKNYSYRFPKNSSEIDPEDSKIQYQRRGKILTYTLDDMPKNEENEKKHVDDMNDEEYDAKIKHDREWDNWKDDHERGSGNPYFRK